MGLSSLEGTSMSTSYTQDPLLSWLLNVPQSEAERALAARYAPFLHFDRNEPFFPLAAGYTVFRRSGPSPSFRQGHEIDLAPGRQPPASLAIEYAIWWDWDIGHLYELEHVWVYVDETGHVVRGQASWHGDLHDMQPYAFRCADAAHCPMKHRRGTRCTDSSSPDTSAQDGQLALERDHLIVYSEPGKHAFAPTPDWFRERQREFKRSETGALAGAGGVLITRFTEGRVAPTPLNHRLAHSYLAQRAFEPSWVFDSLFRFTPGMLVPWPALKDWIPRRVNYWLDRLAHEIPPGQYRVLRIGHRGASAHATDNTLVSLRTAAELGADMVEFDLQRTADGHVVLAHDAWLVDDLGRVRPIRQSRLNELLAIDLGGGERVPTLDQALELCRDEQLGAYIEIKDGSVLPALAAAVNRHGVAGHTIVGSFRPDWLAEWKALAPKVATSILFSSTHLDPVHLARSIDAQYVHPCWERFPNPSALLTPEWIAQVREAGLGIICWHEERPEQIVALRQLGVDGICSDAPELLLDTPPPFPGPAPGTSSHIRRSTS
jgi:glycerophosphoryl diester phosphodiesterase